MLLYNSGMVLVCPESLSKHGTLHQGLDYIPYLRYCIDFDCMTVAESLRGVAPNVFTRDIKVTEFKIQSRYCIFFQNNVP